MSFDHSDTDDWQLAPETLKVDRPKLLEIEMAEEPVAIKQCRECDEPMFEHERYYDLCERCSAKYGIMRVCDSEK